MNTYLITGGTGTLGTALTRILLARGHKVRVLARNEHGHERLRASIGVDQLPRLSSLLGNVEDLGRLERAAVGVDYVIHAAAQKIIPFAEYNPAECVLTNVTGTINAIAACIRGHVKRAVFVSTDKASSPSTLYGGTKFVAERLFLNANRYSAGHGPEFAAVRYGNVFGSQGSVIHAWKKQAAEGKPISITDPQCTRFHLHLHQACAFVLQALDSAAPGELWVPKLPSYRLGDLGSAFRQVFGVAQQPSIEGLRTAEKLHESMISPDESPSMKSEEDLHYVLEPGVIHRKDRWEYNSGMNAWKLGVEALTEEIREWAGKC